jgi:hypothetical protein
MGHSQDDPFDRKWSPCFFTPMLMLMLMLNDAE